MIMMLLALVLIGLELVVGLNPAGSRPISELDLKLVSVLSSSPNMYVNAGPAATSRSGRLANRILVDVGTGSLLASSST